MLTFGELSCSGCPELEAGQIVERWAVTGSVDCPGEEVEDLMIWLSSWLLQRLEAIFF